MFQCQTATKANRKFINLFPFYILDYEESSIIDYENTKANPISAKKEVTKANKEA